jgi:hypothetical protein
MKSCIARYKFLVITALKDWYVLLFVPPRWRRVEFCCSQPESALVMANFDSRGGVQKGPGKSC